MLGTQSTGGTGMRRFLAFVAIALAALVGCTGKPGASTGSKSPTASASLSESAFLQQLRKGFADPKFRVTYGVQQTGTGTGGSVTFAQDRPKESFRSVFGADTRLVIQDAHNTVVCDTAYPCSRFTGDADSLQLPVKEYIYRLLDLRDFVESNTDLPGFTGKGPETIDDRAASCASWSYSSGTVDVCADDETGVVLSFQQLGNLSPTLTNTVIESWTASSFGTSTAADFKATRPIG